MEAHLVAWTTFAPPPDVSWEPGAGDAPGEALVEFAGRACYASWSRPNPATATNATYVRHLVDVGHLSVLEHATATFWITGVSRSLTHELVRHRHLSCSQRSQRFVDESRAAAVVPPALRDRPDERAQLAGVHSTALRAYSALVARLVEAGLPRKEARQTARSVLPNATATELVVTGNLRAWREVVTRRAAPDADAEFRELARVVLRRLLTLAPSAFADLADLTVDRGSTRIPARRGAARTRPRES